MTAVRARVGAALLTTILTSGALAALAPSSGGGSTAASQAASAPGSIRGRLILRQAPPRTERRPGVADPGAAGPHDAADRRPGVVYLEQAPRGAFDDRDLPRAVMDQRNERFVPHLLAVMAGTVVDFPNSDRTYHNVFSLSRARRFDLGRYAAGKSKSVRMDRPGVVRVFCDIHSHMSAFILVFAHPYFDVTDADGRFELSPVPPGTYTVIGWHEGDARIRRSVTVAPGTSTEVDLPVP